MAVFDPDAEDIKRVAKGDPSAAARLVRAHGDRLLAVAWRMLGSQAAAEEIVQETFLRMWRHAASWQPGKAKFSTWLHRVTVNLCYDYLRKASVKYELTAGDDLPEQQSAAPDAEQQMVEDSEVNALRQAIDRLPERQKMALILCLYQECSNAQAAEIMEVSVEAIESLLARARKALKADLQLKQDMALEA
ncbi:MAG: RNA polymerase sigma factor [bacterium]